MRSIAQYLFPVLLLWPLTYNAAQTEKEAQVNKSKSSTTNMQQFFIDKFFVPARAVVAFKARVKINRDFIRGLPGFIEDHVYEYTDEQGNLTCITVATWASVEAVNKAKEAVQAEYKKQNFDPADMLEKLQIKMDRGVYKEVR